MDPELAVLEARLLRSVRIRRLVLGFAAIIFGIGFVVMGSLLFRPRLGIPRLAMSSVGMGIALTIVGGVILRRGELRADGRVHQVDPIPWSTLGPVAGGIGTVIGLIAAWPLGAYEWMGTLASPCRSLITSADVRELALMPFDVDAVRDDSLQCVLTGVEPGTTQRVLAVVIAGDKGGSQFPNALRFLGGEQTPIAGIGDEGYLVERSHEYVVIAKRRHAAVLVHLASRRYDRDSAMRVAEHVAKRIGLAERYADAWDTKYPGHR